MLIGEGGSGVGLVGVCKCKGGVLCAFQKRKKGDFLCCLRSANPLQTTFCLCVCVFSLFSYVRQFPFFFHFSSFDVLSPEPFFSSTVVGRRVLMLSSGWLASYRTWVSRRCLH